MSMKTYSMDLRERIVAAVDAGKQTQYEVAASFGVSLSWLKELLQQRAKTGSLKPKPHAGGRTPKFKGESLDALKKQVEEHPDATLEELRELCGVRASVMAVHRALERLDCHRKKSPSTRRNKTVPTFKHSAPNGGLASRASIRPA
jgi:transposase